jgi:2-polyprenyl-6-methoxyphenol hydroxylase-like FAD-dependent oxidoreductase
VIPNETIEKNVGHFLPPRVEECEPNTRGSFKLGFLHSNNYVSKRIALIGDAVHRVHPLAGQGVNLGFGDVVALTKSLKNACNAGADIGSLIYLKEYETKRQTEAYSKIIGIDLLNKLYTDQNHNEAVQTAMRTLRSIGLTISNRLKPLKKLYINEAVNK